MERTSSAIFVFFNVLQAKKFSHVCNLQPCMVSFIFKGFVKILLQKTTLIIIFNKYKQSDVFWEKNKSASPAMHGWGISLNNKGSSKQEKKYV